MYSVNKESMKIVKKIIENCDKYNVEVHNIEGATVIDCGINKDGGWEVAKLFTKILFGGTNEIEYGVFSDKINDINYRSVIVSSDFPVLQQAGCNISGWELKKGHFAPILAGPGRTVARKPNDWFAKYSDYEDSHCEAVITVESSSIISSQEVKDLIQATGVLAKDLYILVAPSGSTVCSVQVAARILEQSLHRLCDEGFNLGAIIEAHGYAVVPPVVKDDLLAMGRLNDVLIYGGQATYTVDCEDSEIEKVISIVPSFNSTEYGRIFKDIYEENGCNFFNIDMRTYSPAKLVMINQRTGNVFSSGEINIELLAKSFKTNMKG